MILRNRFVLVFAILSLSIFAHADGVPSEIEMSNSIHPTDSIALPGFPVIGKWMIDQTGEIAHWLTYVYKGKKLAEPINVIIRVNRPSEAEAKQALMDAASLAGFTIRKGHTSGYQALIGDTMMGQFPDTAGHAFSNIAYVFPNNHGRIFGPLAYDGRFYFVAAFSREGVDWIGKIFRHGLLHRYDSFMQARDQFVEKICAQGGATNSGTVNMENALPENDPRATGDHDGTASVIDLN